MEFKGVHGFFISKSETFPAARDAKAGEVFNRATGERGEVVGVSTTEMGVSAMPQSSAKEWRRPLMDSLLLCLLMRSFLRSLPIFVIASLGEIVSPVLHAQQSASLISSTEPGWPQFRGPRRDGICEERGLLISWPETGPKELWSVAGLGRGFSSPTITNGRLFITGDVDAELRIFAFDLEGKPLWTARNGDAWRDEYPGARASVTCHGGFLFHQNAHGRVACFDVATGAEQWAVNLLERFGGKNISWGISECLAVDERAVYSTAGGSKAAVVAMDRKTGNTLWQSVPIGAADVPSTVHSPSYVSPILVEFGGRRLLIGCTLRDLYCVDAANGAMQWTKPFPTRYSVLAMMPVLLAGGRIFMSAPHGTGGHCYQLAAPTAAESASPVGVEEVWSSKLDTCQGGVIHSGGRLYGSYYSDRKGWAAIDGKNGEILYSNGDFLKGAALLAENRLYALSEDGWMRLLEPAESKFEVKGQFRFAEAARRDAWAHPVIHERRLYLRYHDKLTVFDVAREKE